MIKILNLDIKKYLKSENKKFKFKIDHNHDFNRNMLPFFIFYF